MDLVRVTGLIIQQQVKQADWQRQVPPRGLGRDSHVAIEKLRAGLAYMVSGVGWRVKSRALIWVAVGIQGG